MLRIRSHKFHHTNSILIRHLFLLYFMFSPLPSTSPSNVSFTYVCAWVMILKLSQTPWRMLHFWSNVHNKCNICHVKCNIHPNFNIFHGFYAFLLCMILNHYSNWNISGGFLPHLRTALFLQRLQLQSCPLTFYLCLVPLFLLYLFIRGR